MKIQDRLPRFLREFRAGQVIVLVAVILGIGVGVALGRWDWLRGGDGAESNGETLRNIILAVGAMVALVLAPWRSLVAERQANTARRSLAYERFQRGVEMIGSPVLSVRLGGIYALDQLAKEWWGYHVQVMRVLCAFVRNPPHDHDAPRPDVQDAVSVIGRRRTKDRIQREQDFGYQPDLSHANLRGVKMGRMNFSDCNFEGTDLSGATLTRCDLSGAHLEEATLRGATLSGANLERADMTRADLSSISAEFANFTNAAMWHVNLSYAMVQGANFQDASLGVVNLTGAVFYKDGLMATGLTQRQIDLAEADENTPPIIDGLPDAETEQRIQWSARPTIIT